VGKDFRLTKKTKICCLQAKRTQHEFNVFNGSRVYVKDSVGPSKFKWCPESPKKKEASCGKTSFAGWKNKEGGCEAIIQQLYFL